MSKNYFGVMMDMSRNAVMKVDTLKKYIDYLAMFGYNMLMLYTEDTYEVNGEPYFGYLRGGYTKNELKEIDAYCNANGIELIPCVQTLAHLKTIFKWFAYKDINDTADILLIDEPRTYELIENMFSTLAECFTSKKIHIGMDEAHFVGLGKYMDKHGYTNRYELLNKHLSRVVEIAKKHGFKPMMWSDMFFRVSNGGEYYSNNANLPQELIDGVSDVSLVYWDYYHTKKNDYKSMIKAHKKFGTDIWFAGGTWSWIGFVPANRYTLQTMRAAMDSCKETDVKNIFITLWGDNGKERSYFALLSSLFYIKKYYDGIKSKKQIARKFEELTGEPFDRLMCAELPNYVCDNKDGFGNPSKYMLYNDPFFGFFDTQVQDNVDIEYKKLAKRFSIYASKSESFGYIYDFLSKLCRTLSLKYNLGVKVRVAYKSMDRDGLKNMVSDFKKTERAMENFHRSFYELWHKENKPNGFEVQDLRLGGVIQRLKTCRRRLESYLSGEESILPELEEELLDFWGNGKEYCKDTLCYPDWNMIVSANQI